AGYKAGKWGQYLRAPDVYFNLMDRCGDRMAPMYEVAEVKFGFKTGVDKFFCVRDVTEDEVRKADSTEAFQKKWAISPDQTKRLRVIRDGEGGLHLVEARYLEPEFHRLTEATRIVVKARDVKKMVINAPVARARLRGTHLGRYVAYAEGKGWHKGSTVASRARTRPWYDLGLLPKGERAQMFWPMAQQYRHVVSWNGDGMPSNHNLFDVWASEGIDARVLWGVLNSTVVALTKHQFGRPAGIEGSLKTEVVDAKMMLVPDPRAAAADVQRRVVEAAEVVAGRRVARMLPEEFELEDRQRLDDAVLELMGIDDAEERQEFRKQIYSALDEMYRATRERELVAQRDRARAARRGRNTPAEMAEDIWEEHYNTLGLVQFPEDFVQRWTDSEFIDLPDGQVEPGIAMMETGRQLRVGTIRVGGTTGIVMDVGSLEKGLFLKALAECGHYGSVRVPNEEECVDANREFERYKSDLAQRFATLAAQRTRDERRQRPIVAALMRKALAWRHEHSPSGD
ncbi:MAG: hypothetical protein IID01_10335, partial [Chloroflexi bacterium]|nr:hypothetical protein [Chloroflexota bacterium]